MSENTKKKNHKSNMCMSCGKCGLNNPEKKKKNEKKKNEKKKNEKKKKTKKCLSGFPKTENIKVFNRICKNNTMLAESVSTGKYNQDKYLYNKVKGIYTCSCCGNKLYNSKYIYDSHSGWPAFSKVLTKKSVKYDSRNNELSCYNCGLHLGHRFFDSGSPSGIHDCINSVCLYLV
jgi:peptide-methionine (R)-S-oxide reductase